MPGDVQVAKLLVGVAQILGLVCPVEAQIADVNDDVGRSRCAIAT